MPNFDFFFALGPRVRAFLYYKLSSKSARADPREKKLDFFLGNHSLNKSKTNPKSIKFHQKSINISIKFHQKSMKNPSNIYPKFLQQSTKFYKNQSNSIKIPSKILEKYIEIHPKIHQIPSKIHPNQSLNFQNFWGQVLKV